VNHPRAGQGLSLPGRRGRRRAGAARGAVSPGARRLASPSNLVVCLVAALLPALAWAQIPVQEPRPSPTEPITIAADSIRNWTENDERVLILKGNVFVSQGIRSIRAPQAVVWVKDGQGRAALKKIELYADGGVRVDGARKRSETKDLLETLETRTAIAVEMKERLAGSAVDDAVYQRALARRGGSPLGGAVHQAAFQAGPDGGAGDEPLRRIRLGTRTFKPWDLETVDISADERAWVITGGLNLIVYNVAGIGTVDILTDRAVIWWPRGAGNQGMAGAEITQSQREPLEVYLEGNVVVRQGPRTIECKYMYYDVARSVAVASDAELEADSEQIGSPVYFRARQLRQVAEQKFIADRTQVTLSRFPTPGYDLQTEQAVLEGVPKAAVDPKTGQPTTRTGYHISATNNFFHIEGLPVLFLPSVEKDLEELSTPLRRVAVRQSRTYGTELHTTWDMFQLLGREQPDSIRKWDLDLDYMSERGPGAGTLLDYRGDSFLGIEGKNWGLIDTWWLYDEGEDRLGEGRKDIQPEEHTRGRFLYRHRQHLPSDFSLNVEIAWITDINFLEQFFEREWEEDKDHETALYLKQQRDNWAWSVTARARLMDFLTTTNQMPQLDFYLLGEPLLWDRLTYFQHSSIGYLELLDADRTNGDIYPGTLGNDGPTFVGGRADTLHEIDLPFSAGPFRIVPYAVGRASWWSRAIEHDDEDRLWGAAGARASLPLWRVYPCVENDLFNVHGLAHKIVFSVDYSWAESDLDHDLLPQYDELEDDSEQTFRKRFLFRDYGLTTFGSLIPPTGPAGIDPRLYAIRRGLMTAPESVDDLHVLRFGARQRLQTKRGVPGERRVIDWMTLDTQFAWFPNEDEDNFGEDFGLITYDYAWHIGDRTSILSHGWFETYEDAPMIWNVGVFMERPPRGSFYIGYNILDPIDSRVLKTSYNYWMSPKWISSFTTSYDFGETENLGQSIVLTRIGADLVFRVGFSFNPLRDNYGIGVEIMPRVAPDLHLGSIGGPRVPIEFAPQE